MAGIQKIKMPHKNAYLKSKPSFLEKIATEGIKKIKRYAQFVKIKNVKKKIDNETKRTVASLGFKSSKSTSIKFLNLPLAKTKNTKAKINNR